MDIRTNGGLRTLVKWEDLLATLPEHAKNIESLGRMWKLESPARRTGQDPTLKEGWRLAVVRGVEWKIPTDETNVVEVGSEDSATGKSYTLVRIDRTAVHLHDGVKIVDGVVTGDVHVCVRTFWPKGAEKRPEGTKNIGWKNYLLFLDVYPTTTHVEQTLDVREEGVQRSYCIMLGERDYEEEDYKEGEEEEDDTNQGDEREFVVAWASRSANFSPSNRTGSDQLLYFAKK